MSKASARTSVQESELMAAAAMMIIVTVGETGSAAFALARPCSSKLDLGEMIVDILLVPRNHLCTFMVCVCVCWP